jgi:hypothetical protein
VNVGFAEVRRTFLVLSSGEDGLDGGQLDERKAFAVEASVNRSRSTTAA